VTDIPSIVEPTEAPSFAVLSYPAQPPSASEGRQIYLEHCAECHGEDGSGVVPGSRNFQDLDYMRGESLANFYAAVTEGRGDMPGYNEILSSDERWDVVFYVWRHSTRSTTLEEGENIYEQNCATCHGEDGSGELLGSADFTNLREMDQLAPRDLYLTVTQGRGSMPALQSLLPQDERWAVIDYVLTFTYDPNLEGEIGTTSPSSSQATDLPAELTCSPEQTNPFSWDDETVILAGELIYENQCSVCHGQDGSGGLPAAPDFTSQEVNAELLNNPGTSYCSLVEGIGVMPGFEGTLTEDEIWQVLTYMASLGP
jgi:mono/diheme cytochrome c family protein